MDRLGVGIVGLSAQGGWAGLAHVPALRALEDRFLITGLAATTLASAGAAARAFDIPFFTDSPAELASRADVDLVVITVKVPLHAELVMHAIRARKRVYCEWPLGNGLAEAMRIGDAADRIGVRGFVGLQARTAPPLRYLAALVREGFVGEVLSSTVSAGVGSPWDGTTSERRAYLNDKSNGATLLTIPFAHTLDALVQVLGPVEPVHAQFALRQPQVRIDGTSASLRSDVADQVVFSGITAAGVPICMHYRGHASCGDNFRWDINGTEGDILVTGGNGHFQYGLVDLFGARGRGGTLAPLPVPTTYQRVALDRHSHAYTVAHAYEAVSGDLRQGSRNAATFSDAIGLHRLIETVSAFDGT